MNILNTQKFHYGIESIERLGRVLLPGEEMPQSNFHLVPQRYDNLRYQQIFSRLMDGRLASIRHRSKLTKIAREAITLARLSRLVDFSFKNIQFYRELYKSVGYKSGEIRSISDFEKLPIISKSDLCSAPFHEIVGPGISGVHYRSRTSGSSGTPLDYAYGSPKCFFEMANYLWMGEVALGRPIDHDRWIYNIHNARWWLSSLQGRYKTYCVADIPPLKDLSKHLSLLRPQVLVTLPSHLTKLCEIAEDIRQAGIGAITTNSEQSSRSQRSLAEKLIGVPVRDEYSSTELGTIAFEGSDGQYYVFEDSVHIEIVNKNPHGVGEIIGTRLTNRIMPTIRYRQGDYATSGISDNNFDCKYNSISEIHGRINSSFISKNGSLIASGSLMSIIDEYLTDRKSNISAFKITQKTTQKIEILYASNNISPETVSALGSTRSNINRIFGYELEFEIKLVDKISSIDGFKRQYLFCEV